MKPSRAALIALTAGAVSLRPEIVAVGPLLPRIQEELGSSHGVTGLIVAIPVLAMGLFAPLGAGAAARFGMRRAITFSLGLIAVFGFVRLLSDSIELLLLLTVPIGLGMALTNALFPLAARVWFADRPLGATAAYTTGMQVGAGVTSLVAVPLALWLGGWRESLVVVGLTSLVSLVAWMSFAPKDARRVPGSPVAGFKMPLRSPLAWRLVIAMGLLGMCFWGVNSWLTGAFIERGWSEVSAAVVAAMLNVGAVFGNAAVFLLDERGISRRLHMIVASVIVCLGTVLLILVPGGAIVWGIIIGLGNGLLFPALMTLPIDVARDPREVAEVAGMMLGIGYVMSGLAPFVLGAVRDATGSFESVLWLSAAFAAGVTVTVTSLSPARLELGMRGPREAAVPIAGGP